MLRQIRLQKYPKKCSVFRPQILSSLTLLQKKPYNSSTNLFIAHDTHYNLTYQLYHTSTPLHPSTLQNIQFISSTPNILILSQQPHNIIIQQQYHYTLKQHLIRKQQQTQVPYLIKQEEIRQIICDLLTGVAEFNKNNIQYDCISEENIVRKNGKWQLSLTGMLTGNRKRNKDYYDQQNKSKQNIIYALAILMFKLTFGFVPFENTNKKPNQLNFNTYIDYLDKSQKSKKMLKVYYYSQHVQSVCVKLKSLISDCLSTNKIKTIQQFLSHEYFFDQQLNYQENINNNINKSSISMNKSSFVQNNQIKMISYFDNKYHSLIMASIQYKKKNPYEKLNQKPETSILQFIQTRQTYKIDPLLTFLQFAPVGNQENLINNNNNFGYQINNNNSNLKNNNNPINLISTNLQFFHRQFQSLQFQKPTLQLIKLIQKDKLKCPHLYSSNPQRQSMIKLYAFPYTIIFQLINIYNYQLYILLNNNSNLSTTLQQTKSLQIKKKIQSLIPLLLNVSNLNFQIEEFEKLHPVNKHNLMKFQDIKYKYRELINFLYKHFLMQAMKKYNAKKENLTIAEKLKLKQEGLEYYRLCLKLMEASVIIRKKGKDLDLQRIQTSQRKQIQNDLEELLKTYFPNKVEIK